MTEWEREPWEKKDEGEQAGGERGREDRETRTRWARNLISAVGKSRVAQIGQPRKPRIDQILNPPLADPTSPNFLPNIALWGFSCGRPSSVIFEQLIDYRRRNSLFTGGRKGTRAKHPSTPDTQEGNSGTTREREKRELVRPLVLCRLVNDYDFDHVPVSSF